MKFSISTGLIKWIYLLKWKLVLLAPLFSISSIFSQDLVLRFNHLTVKDGLSQNRVHGIVKDKYGFMWFSTWEGLSKYDGYKFVNYIGDSNNPKTLKNARIIQMYKDTNENLWLLTSDTLIYRYDYETDDFSKFTKYNAPQNIADSLRSPKAIFYTFQKKNGYGWIVYQLNNVLSKDLPLNNIDNILTQINYKTGHEYKYKHNQLDPWSLNDEYVFCIYSDDNDMFWVGTYGGGVNKADLKQKQIRLYQHSVLDKNTIIDNAIRAICEDNHGNLWVGTNNKGFTKFNRSQNKCTHYQFNPQDTKNSLINNQVRIIFYDRYGYLWIGTKAGLDRFDPRNNRFRHYSHTLGNNIPDDIVFWISEDRSDNIWIATFNGIAKYDRKNDRFIAYKTDYFSKQNRVRVIINGAANNLWIATDGGGLLCLQRDTSAGFEEKLSFVASYQNSPQDTNSLIDNKIYTMLEDKNGFLWLGTGGGLDRFDPRNKTFTHFTKKNGLPDELIVGGLSDSKGNIWVSHKRGLSKIDTKTCSIRNYTAQDGLQDSEFSEDAYFKNNFTGEMFFGGVSGLNSFFPDSIKDNPLLPKIVFTNLEISNTPVPLNKPFNGRIILNKPLYMTQSITLMHQDKSVSIEFAALHYANPNNNKYAYKLEGFDQNWINTDASRRIATYSNLEPRTYTFKVKASNNDGLWNPIPAELTIIVLPPWWKTLVFRMFFILACLLLIFLFFYWRVASYRSKEAELKLLVQQRTEELEHKNLELLKEQIVIEEQSETLKLANENLKDQQSRLEEYAEETQSQNEKLKTVNEQLLEHQARIEEQSEELRAHVENIKEANDLLIEKQKLIQQQSQRLEQTNQQLAILNATKDRFFSIIAHDLRNPFHAVTGLSEILLNGHTKLPAAKIEKFLNLIHTTSISGNNLLENLLQWSRSQTGRISFKPANIVLAPLVEENLNLLEGESTRKNITVRSLIEPDITIFADENMVKTIFRNLVSNAIKFTYENGHITITANKNGAFVEITVTDTGIGIPEKTKNLLFNIDTNISTKGTSNETGTGLGLILCKEFIERHSGKIWVESEINKGSEFIFTLPLP